MKKSILDVARVIRSKNSGPYELTLDIMFNDRRYFELFRSRGIIDVALVGQPVRRGAGRRAGHRVLRASPTR